MSNTTGYSESRGVAGEQVWTNYVFDVFGNIESIARNKTYVRVPYRNFTSGFKNPIWRHLIRNHTDATTAFSGEKRVITYGGFGLTRDGTTLWPFAGPLIGPYLRRTSAAGSCYPNSTWLPMSIPTTDTAAAASATNQAIQKLYARLLGFETSVNAGEDIGEIRQTIRLVKHPFKPLRDLTLSAMRKWERILLINNPSRAIKLLADAHLEWRFGVQPLINTVAKGLVGLQNRDIMSDYVDFVAQGEAESQGSNYSLGTFNGGVLDVPGRGQSRTKYQCRFVGQWHYSTNVPQKSVAKVLGLTSRDFISTLYNLTPWTWALDYVSNMGTIVDSLSVPWGGVAWCARTDRSETFHKTTFDGGFRFPLVHVYNESMIPGFYQCLATRVTRTPVTVFPVPAPEFHLPTSTGQYQNLAAAITQKLPVIGKLVGKLIKSNPNAPALYRKEVRARERGYFPTND